jgi:hypothetical protein
MRVDESPVEMEHVACETHHHRPHAKVDEASGRQTTHDSVNQRITRAAVAPCHMQLLVVLELLVAVAWMKSLELECWFGFQSLCEVNSPMQPTQERL